MVGRLLHMGWLGGSTRSTTGRQAPGAVGTRMVVRAGRPLPYLPADGDVGAGGGGHWLKEGPNAAAVRHGGSSGAGGFCKCSRSMYDNIEVACAYRLRHGQWPTLANQVTRPTCPTLSITGGYC